ncbi:hypothetical protein PZH44_16665, partial [Alistipes putredinis]|uniref:hypothetical protein n=1 Tax=Alistipes putredinis TaxID=28117 RepID=UPI0023B1D0EB
RHRSISIGNYSSLFHDRFPADFGDRSQLRGPFSMRPTPSAPRKGVRRKVEISVGFEPVPIGTSKYIIKMQRYEI